jgi:REP element-mobilizing transposase RayT
MDNEVSSARTGERGATCTGSDPGHLQEHDVSIMKGHVAKDNVHLLISLPPQVTISCLLQWLRGKTAHHPLLEFPT